MLGLLLMSFAPAFAYAKELIINVGGNGTAIEFSPQQLDSVQLDDIVTFYFTTAGHAVAQTSASAPCTFIDDGFASARIGVAGTTLSIQILDTATPIYFACSIATHCQNGGVGAINAGASFPDFLAAATSSDGGGFANRPFNGTDLGSGVSARVVTSPLAVPGSSKLSVGALVGIILVALLLVVGAGLFLRHWLIATRVRRVQKRTEWKRRLENRLSQVKASDDAAVKPDIGIERGAEDVPRM